MPHISAAMRIKLDLSALTGQTRLEWMLVDPSKTATVEALAGAIAAKKAIASSVEIQMEGCLLPDDESVDILQNGDVVSVVEKQVHLLAPPAKKIKLEPGVIKTEAQSSSEDEQENYSVSVVKKGHRAPQPGIFFGQLFCLLYVHVYKLILC